ncbi:MAG: hypothetical protein HQ592_16740 [Planctomycetes bacterium]|nr:hypothetical protein [Planctomycetota bacterium]
MQHDMDKMRRKMKELKKQAQHMMRIPKRTDAERLEFILPRLPVHPIAQVHYHPDAPAPPPDGTPEYVEHLNRWAQTVIFEYPGVPVIQRVENRFVLIRMPPAKKLETRVSIYTALVSLLIEIEQKTAAEDQ